VDYYERMRRTGLRAAYRAECDFMDWTSEQTREAIDPSCTAAGETHTVFLWGDSFAQALSAGIREQLPPGAALAQVATSGCAAAIENFDLTVPNRRCEKTNLYAMDSITRLKPALVIVAQAGGHLATDWPALVARLRQLGAGRVAIVGPFPVWQPGLPRVYADHHLDDRSRYVSTGVVAEPFDVDRRLAAAVAGVPHAIYVSLLGSLCRDGACLASVPGEDAVDLMALDSAHLTPRGSSYVGRAVMKPLLESAGVR
jgi:hypothetical protein